MSVDQPRVLIVEDEAAQREVLAYNLAAEGFDVMQAEQGEDALLLVAEELPDIIVLDWMMPNLSGIEVCRQLKSRSKTRGIPIIMLSARSIGETLTYEDIALDGETHKVTRDGTPLKLGPTEFRLLRTFMEKPGRVWSRDQLLDRVWGRDVYVDTRTVDVHVGRLRKALTQHGGDDPLRTVRGAGYALG